MADEFIEPARLGYVRLKPAPQITTTSDGIGERNLVDDRTCGAQELLDKLGEESERFFDFEAKLFKFHGRFDRGLWHLIWHPQSYADLEEENIEEKFPGDIQSRALVCALNNVIRHNQRKHILKKRLLQAIATAPLIAAAVFWFSIVAFLAERIDGITAFGYTPDVAVTATGAAIGLCVGYVALAASAMRFALSHMMHAFSEVNASSCQVLSNHMTRTCAKIKGISNKLLNIDITLSQNNLESIKHEDWPSKIEQIFKLALWEPKRIEAMERFWQLQLERLRRFEALSDAIGNWLSRGLAAGLVGATLAWIYVQNGGFVLHAGTLAMMLGAWYFGRLTRRRQYSFGMDEIVQQGFERNWIPFGSVRYYHNIAQQFRSSKGEIRMYKLRIVFPGSTATSTQPPS
jgi:hypothetical protein